VRKNSPFSPLKSGLIVSCQVQDGTAINTPAFIAAQALTVIQAGAIGIRAQGIANVAAISNLISLPIIGLVKRYDDSSPVFITPAISDVIELEAAGANIVAIDATDRLRPGLQSFEDFMTQLRLESNVAILADVDSLEAALIAHSLGCEAVATTLSGYTDKPAPVLPNIKLIQQIADQINIPIIAEGGFSNPESVREALDAGAWSVCVGTSITNPFLLTQKFLASLI
jgi:putative N-acetylmannosamine-6-phosphate epimerase